MCVTEFRARLECLVDFGRLCTHVFRLTLPVFIILPKHDQPEKEWDYRNKILFDGQFSRQR